ncbi:adenosine deaminase [Pediococcus ethanolidurans]|uniref:Adenine deaminase n=1 Tax=Pediococcus ethanolidurans TaxID=319653 RepID=A0A0R2K4X2_9LACO|nr:adenosine deaminase [Pediococcus ethanolidurans]KRN81594.1 putative deaminase [Pediococcus ethanolidurans]GEN95424.1 adenine deaminase [Pediococcus ethanolidurans]SER69346.1 adenosine deaminase [Pediococcus ethanolidurans]
MANTVTRKFIDNLPKAELHVHLEGTLEPELRLKLAQKNHIDIGTTSLEALKKTYQYDTLASFLAVYYEAMAVLQTEDDFYELAFTYLKKARQNNVRYVEMFFDPQAHTSRGIAIETVINGFSHAAQDAKEIGVDAHLIMCFLRDFSKASAYQSLIAADPYKDKILGIGLDSDEHHNPPLKFVTSFEKAVSAGYHITMHADVDQVDSINHIKQALEIIGVERLDHGTNIVENPDLVEFVSTHEIGLTSCPNSNKFLSQDMKGKEVQTLLEHHVKVSINSDDPAYFGGYINDNYWSLAQSYHLTQEQVVQLAKNSFETAWITDSQKTAYKNEIKTYLTNFS